MTARQAYRHLKQALAFLEEREAEAEAREILLEICGVSVQQLLLDGLFTYIKIWRKEESK